MKLKCEGNQTLSFIEPDGNVFYTLTESYALKEGTPEERASKVVAEYLQVNSVCLAEVIGGSAWAYSVENKLQNRENQLRRELMDICAGECLHLFQEGVKENDRERTSIN